MKISFQIIHNYQAEPLKIIGTALRLTIQDDLYIELDLRTALDFLKITLNKTLHSTEQLCFFEIDIDNSTYDLSKYDDFINGFVSRLSTETGFVRLVKFVDELRNVEYQKYYNEVAEIEMKLREVFSYIFYNRYLVDEVDDLNEYDIKLQGEPKKADYISRFENPFFYFNINSYKDSFQRPRGIPYDIKEWKDIFSKIRNSTDFEVLKEMLEVKGVTSSEHTAFFIRIKEDVDSIEKLRNCIAHNRATTHRIVDNYEKSKINLVKQIKLFWETEISTLQESNELTLSEIPSYSLLNGMLSMANWDENANTVSITEMFLPAQPTTKVNNIEELRSYLISVSDSIADENKPGDTEQREHFEQEYNAQRLVEKLLKQYNRDLIIMGWI